MTSKALFSLSFLALTSACQNLEPIDANVCGNRIVEPANGEDCDGEANCGTLFTDDEAACRFTCSVSASVACPTGFGCGLDGICRQPSGKFENMADVDSPTLFVQSGDIDGDGRPDLFRTGIDETAAQFYDDDFALTAKTSIQREPGGVAPLLAQLTFDEEGVPDVRADVALSLELTEKTSGLTIYRSQTDRSLAPTAYSTLNLAGEYAFGVSLNVLTPTNQDQVIAFIFENKKGVMVGIDADDPTPFYFRTGIVPVNPLNMTGVATGSLIENQSPCDEIVWTSAATDSALAADKLFIFQPCAPDTGTMGAVWNGADDQVIVITLPRDLLVYGADLTTLGEIPNYFSNVFITDMDGDEDDDIVVMLGDKTGDSFENGKPVFWIENEGDDTWDDDNPVHQETHVAVDTAAPGVDVLLESCDDYDLFGDPLPDEVRAVGIPLAITDLNGDQVVDYITDDSIWMSRPTVGPVMGTTFEHVASCLEWSKVVIADFDRNGHKDIAAGRIFEPGIDVALGSGDGAFTWNVISTQREVLFLKEGDFDGDFVTDLSFLSIDLEADPEDGPTDTLFVAFAAASGGFESPVTLGTLRQARGLLAGRIQGGDATNDILVESSNVKGDLAVAIFLGDGARQIVAPYLLQDGSGMDGRFSEILDLAAGTFGVAALTKYPAQGKSGLWALEISGEADLAGNADASATLDYCEFCMLAALDLDDDGADELVVLGDETGKSYGSGSNPNSPFESTGTIGGLTGLCFDSQGFNEAVVVDLDQDGRRDLMAIAEGCDAGGAPHVVIFWNDGTGSLDGNNTTRIPLEGVAVKDRFPSLGALNVDADPELELVVSVPTSVSYDGSDEGESRVFEVAPELGTLVFGEGALIVVLGDDELYPATSQATGDFNGDGVPDLVLSRDDSYTLLRGVPVR